MPTYSSICTECRTAHEYVRRISERNDTPVCCDAPTTKTLDAPQVSAMNWGGHKGFAIGNQWIETGQDYQKYLKENNKIPASEGHREAEIQKERKDQAHKKVRREAVEKAVNSVMN